jgi:hypothetical protein
MLKSKRRVGHESRYVRDKKCMQNFDLKPEGKRLLISFLRNVMYSPDKQELFKKLWEQREISHPCCDYTLLVDPPIGVT